MEPKEIQIVVTMDTIDNDITEFCRIPEVVLDKIRMAFVEDFDIKYVQVSAKDGNEKEQRTWFA